MTRDSNVDSLERLEATLVNVFHDHADGISVSHDAYARLAETVYADQTHRRLLSFARPISFMAVSAVALGFGVFAINQDGTQVLDAAGVGSATLDGPSAGGTAHDGEAVGTESEGLDAAGQLGESDRLPTEQELPALSEPGGAVSSTAGFESRGTYSPANMSRLAAAESFLDFMGFDNAIAVPNGMKVDVVTTVEGSKSELTEPLATMLLEKTDEGYVVSEVVSASVEFEVVPEQTENAMASTAEDAGAVAVGEVLQVEGRGLSSEGSFEVQLRATEDGSVLQGETVPAARPFGVDIPLDGAGRAWAVVQTAAAGDGAAVPFAAKRIRYEGDPDLRVYKVVGIADDDSDRGLVVRAVPNGAQLGVIPSGATGVTRRNLPPAVAGGLTWWAIKTPEGFDGWSASVHLAVDDAISDAELMTIATDLIAAPANTESSSLIRDYLLPVYPILVGDIGTPRQLQGGLEVPRTWSAARQLPLADGENFSGNLTEFYGVDSWSTGTAVIPGAYWSAEAVNSVAVHFSDLRSVVIEFPRNDLVERVHFFVDRRGGEIVVKGMVRETQGVDADSAVVDPAIDPDGLVEPDSLPETEPDPSLSTDPDPEPESDPKPTSDPEPTSDSEPKSEPKSMSDPKPEPESTPDLDPEPEFGSGQPATAE